MLDDGDDIYVTIVAANEIGESDPSDAVSGSTVFVPIVPAAPVLLQNEPSGTSKTTARFSWSDGENGGKVITDYKIYSDMASGNWAQIDTGITDKVYTATGLSSGLIYQFKVQARNSVGFGALSEAVSILTAIVPDAPAAPTTTSIANDIMI